VITVLRLLIAASAFIKADHRAQWEWSTTFWPYWCSFAIQAILGIASFVIFINTVLNYFKDEALFGDILASFWAFVMTFGFVIGTLLPILNLIQYTDINKNSDRDN
jgi:hypothetical protein